MRILRREPVVAVLGVLIPALMILQGVLSGEGVDSNAVEAVLTFVGALATRFGVFSPSTVKELTDQHADDVTRLLSALSKSEQRQKG